MNNERTQNTSNKQDINDKNKLPNLGTSGTAGQRTSSAARGGAQNITGSPPSSPTQGGLERTRPEYGRQPTRPTSGGQFQSPGREQYTYSTRDQYTDESSGMGAIWAALIGVGAGITAMYLLDPNRGARRRAIATDKLTSAGRYLPQAARETGRDLSNRAYGIWSEATRLFSSDNASDQVVEARVRSKIGRVCSHPHAIHVMSRDGNVTIDGVALTGEVPAILKAIEGTRGVNSVDNQLRQYNSPEGVPSLQGGSRREPRSEFMQENWSPTARIAGGLAGTAAIGIGLGVLSRSFRNMEPHRRIGTGGGSAVTVDKSINVNAPPDVVYRLWSDFENFPRFMSNVLEVRKIGEGRSHWKVAGPAGVPVEWDAITTKVVPNELIAWKSVEGSTVANAGYVLFEPNNDGTTEVTVRLSYNPPAGVIGHAIAKVFGADPKSEMDQDLMRMKALLETGQPPRDAAQPYQRQPDRIH